MNRGATTQRPTAGGGGGGGSPPLSTPPPPALRRSTSSGGSSIGGAYTQLHESSGKGGGNGDSRVSRWCSWPLAGPRTRPPFHLNLSRFVGVLSRAFVTENTTTRPTKVLRLS